MRVLLVAPAHSYRLGSFLQATRRMGVEEVVATDRPVAIDGSALTVDLRPHADPDAHLRDLAGLDCDAVIATDAGALAFAARAALLWRLPRANPPDAVDASLDKVRQRWAYAAAGVAQPAFRVLDDGDDPGTVAARVGFPAVLKPAGLSGGQGVIRAEDVLDARAAAATIRSVTDQRILVEEHVDGPEVAVEGLLDDGRLHVLAVFDKPDATDGPAFPETVLVTPSRLSPGTAARVVEVTAAATAAVGLRHGPVHVELRVDGAGRPRVIELAARSIGGRCARVLRFAGDRSIEELIIAQALGTGFDPTPRPGAVGVFMVPIPATGVVTAVDGIDEVAALPGVDAVEVEVAPGDRVTALPEGAGYAGFVFASAAEPDAVTWTLARAARTVRVSVSPV